MFLSCREADLRENPRAFTFEAKLREVLAFKTGFIGQLDFPPLLIRSRFEGCFGINRLKHEGANTAKVLFKILKLLAYHSRFKEVKIIHTQNSFVILSAWKLVAIPPRFKEVKKNTSTAPCKSTFCALTIISWLFIIFRKQISAKLLEEYSLLTVACEF